MPMLHIAWHDGRHFLTQSSSENASVTLILDDALGRVVGKCDHMQLAGRIRADGRMLRVIKRDRSVRDKAAAIATKVKLSKRFSGRCRAGRRNPVPAAARAESIILRLEVAPVSQQVIEDGPFHHIFDFSAQRSALV